MENKINKLKNILEENNYKVIFGTNNDILISDGKIDLLIDIAKIKYILFEDNKNESNKKNVDMTLRINGMFISIKLGD